MKSRSVEDFYVKTLEVAGFNGVCDALRLPFGKPRKSMFEVNYSQMLCEWYDLDGVQHYGQKITNNTDGILHDEDRHLMTTLVRRGDEHAKVFRGMMVWCEIYAPRYFYQELDRYRIGCECLGSESTMHIEGKGLSEEELVRMKDMLLEGHMQKRVWMFSYQTLRRIYFQRRNHRLPQWRKFCEWIESLPFANAFITVDGKDTDRDEQVSDADNR